MVLMWHQKKPYFWSGTFWWKLGEIPFQVTGVCEVDEQRKKPELQLKRLLMADDSELHISCDFLGSKTSQEFEPDFSK